MSTVQAKFERGPESQWLRAGCNGLPGAAARQAKPAMAPKARALNIKEIQPVNAPAFLDRVAADRFLARYKSGDVVFRQGDPADAVFYIQKGEVQIMALSKDGREGVIAVLGAGEFFGEGCLADQPIQGATATVTAEAAIVRINKQTMIRVLHDKPELSQTFMSFLLSRNIRMEADLADLLFNSIDKRLARILMLMADLGKESGTQAVPMVRQSILAARVGTTRSRINHFMNKFRRLGFIEYTQDGLLTVHNSLLNVVVQD